MVEGARKRVNGPRFIASHPSSAGSPALERRAENGQGCMTGCGSHAHSPPASHHGREALPPIDSEGIFPCDIA